MCVSICLCSLFRLLHSFVLSFHCVYLSSSFVYSILFSSPLSLLFVVSVFPVFILCFRPSVLSLSLSHPRSTHLIPLHPLMSSHANPCHSKSSHVHPCRSMSIQANRCQSTSIHANPCQSMLVHANPCQSMPIYLFSFCLFHYYSSLHLFIHVLLCRFVISADAIRDMDMFHL